ncbi:hypothetical protein [uncultured Methanobrevibacter sp.]|uniref:hypothetical protein n=1 Tax=uncultured Methanobrevibacter sp. TaxID=253161 RepID=UPI0025EFC2EA|nr:hypothetical protein [uncultured Methanobrevibacter sp.]
MSLVSANENNTINTLDDTTHQDNINNQVMENNNNKLAPNEQTTPHENAEKYPKTIHVQGNTFKDIQNAINSAS